MTKLGKLGRRIDCTGARYRIDKLSRLDLDDEYEIMAESHGKHVRQTLGHERQIRGAYGLKARGPGRDAPANRHHLQKRAEHLSQPGYSRASEAFDLLLRAFTARSGVLPPIIGFDGGSIALNQEQCDELLRMLQADSFSLVMNEFSPPLRQHPLLDQSVWRGPHGLLMLCGQTGRDVGDNVTIVSEDRALVHRYLNWWRAHLLEELESTPFAKVSGVLSGSNGVEIRDFSSAIGCPLDRTNYGSDALAFYDKISTELVSDTPVGRLAILDGKPGCGKTFLLRGLVQALSDRAHFIYLPASLVPSLDGPQVLSMLDEMSHHSRRDARPAHKVFIIEDADDCLLTRSSDNMSAVRNLLNFCDGFLGAMLDVRIVATTNSGFVGRTEKVDQALLRPGRLIARVTVPPLSGDVLKAWFVHHVDANKVPVDLPAQMTLAEAYTKARDLGWQPAT